MKYNNLIWIFLLGLGLILLHNTYFPATKTSNNDSMAFRRESDYGNLKHGEVKNYDENGRLKTVINYNKGKKDGLSFVYYDNGQIQLELPYRNNKREGIGKKYYRSGKLYASTPYQNDMVEGTRKLYFENGALKAEIDYHHNLPSTGLREYYKSGKEKYEKRPRIIADRENDLLMITTEADCKKVEFYIGSLIDSQYFTKHPDYVETLPQDKGIAKIDLNVYTPSFIKAQRIICKCVTAQGNPLILAKEYSFN